MRQRIVAFMREHSDQICAYTGCSREEIAMGAGAVDTSGQGNWERFLAQTAQSAKTAVAGGVGGAFADEMTIRASATMLQANLLIFETEQNSSNQLRLYRTIEPMWRADMSNATLNARALLYSNGNHCELTVLAFSLRRNH
jgi:hypothetical protein